MVNIHDQRWVTAGPLWPAALAEATPAGFLRPAVLRLEGDTFMDQLRGVLAKPAGERNETLRSLLLPSEGADKLAPRLFQPVHGHYTVVFASLVCRVPGLPEHALGPRDAVGFVVRRVLGNDEYSWSTTAAQSSPTSPPVHRWSKLTDPATIHDQEELLPLFPVMWTDASRTRRAWAGLVPVSARERYEAAVLARVTPDGEAPLDTLEARFFAPAQALIDGRSAPDLATQRAISRFALLDLAELVPAARTAPHSRQESSPLHVHMPRHDDDAGITLQAAAAAIYARREGLLIGPPPDDLPAINLADLTSKQLSKLRDHITATLPKPSASPEDSKELPPDGTLYQIRCVYRRPPCGLRPSTLVSAPSLPFRMASFLDLDAPHRPTRIPLPDISLAGLAKLKHSVGIVMSAAMRSKTEAASNKDILDGESVDEVPQALGWITIWSIPIITLCATILLMIIAALLNLVFWWLPFLRITIPVPAPPVKQ